MGLLWQASISGLSNLQERRVPLPLSRVCCMGLPGAQESICAVDCAKAHTSLSSFRVATCHCQNSQSTAKNHDSCPTPARLPTLTHLSDRQTRQVGSDSTTNLPFPDVPVHWERHFAVISHHKARGHFAHLKAIQATASGHEMQEWSDVMSAPKATTHRCPQ